MKYDTEWTESRADLSILKEKLVYSSLFKHGNYELLAECIFSFEGLIEEFIVAQASHQKLRLSFKKKKRTTNFKAD